MSTSTSTEQATEDQRFLVVHALKVRGLAPVDELAANTGLEPAALTTVLDALVEEELAKLRAGRVAGYTLTKAGRTAHAALVDEHVSAGERAGVAAAYDAFLPVNARFKQVCTRWQMRPGPDGVEAPNDHDDAGYDAGVIEELAAVHDDVTAALATVTATSPRFARYPDRFASALGRLRAGGTDAFARPLTGSYHDVWMELHEDLLLTLGRERAAADGH